MSKRTNPHRWPEGAIVYQIYPRSFFDSNGDGIGDIKGIIHKLHYLAELGINAIWLSPFYPSPMADFGYDIADYCDVDPIFGKLGDMKELIKKAHQKDIKVLVDLVPNHSSDEHEWFRQSRQSREDKYSDWYIWKDPKGFDENNQPIVPNNWLDIFTGESAWEWEPLRQQFYLHSFDVRQPDLNWENKQVREAIKSSMRFWLDLGADGFRVDAVRFMGKDPAFKNNPKNPHFIPTGGSAYGSILHLNSQGWPQLYDYLDEMASVLKEKPYQDSLRFMVTESYPETHDPVSEYLAYYQGVDFNVAAPFNFEGLSSAWEAETWSKFLTKFHKTLIEFNPLCVPSYAFGNHDQHRLATRLGDTAARSAAVMLLTLPGMAFIYNGEEIGMKNVNIPKSMIKDPAAKGGASRDPERTPMQWSAAKNAGFTTAHEPWLPVSDDFETENVEVQRKDPGSYLSLYTQLAKFRNSSSAIKNGDIKIIKTNVPSVLVYARSKDPEECLVLVNFSEENVEVKLPAKLKVGKFQISSDAATKHKKTTKNIVSLLPFEAAVFAS